MFNFSQFRYLSKYLHFLQLGVNKLVSSIERIPTKKQVTLNMGDRLEIPPGIVHDAHVGPQGVACLEGHEE